MVFASQLQLTSRAERPKENVNIVVLEQVQRFESSVLGATTDIIVFDAEPCNMQYMPSLSSSSSSSSEQQ